MRSNTRSGMPAEGAADRLGALHEALRTADLARAKAARLAGELAGSGECERIEGLPLEAWVGLAARMPGADARALVSTGEVLDRLPVVARLLEAGEVSWDQARRIAMAARRLSAEDCAELDARVEAAADAYRGVDAYDPDGLLWAVEAAVDDRRDRRALGRREQRRREANFLAVQQSLDGGMALYGEYDPVTAAGILGALDAAAGQPRPDRGAAPQDQRGDAAASPHPRRACGDPRAPGSGGPPGREGHPSAAGGAWAEGGADRLLQPGGRQALRTPAAPSHMEVRRAPGRWH